MSEKIAIIPAIDKLMQLLDFLEVNSEASFSDLMGALGFAKSSLHSLLKTAVAFNLVRQAPSGSYGLGLRLFELGGRAVSRIDLKNEALPELQRLRDITNLTCHLGFLEGKEAIYLVKLESTAVVSVRSWEGKRLSLHSTGVGKALIAWRSDEDIDAFFPGEALPVMTSTTIRTRTELKRQLAQIRRQGWAFDDAEELPNVRCVAAPIRNVRGEVAAAVSVVGVDFNMPNDRLGSLARQVVEICNKISRKLGYSGEEVKCKFVKAAGIGRPLRKAMKQTHGGEAATTRNR